MSNQKKNSFAKLCLNKFRYSILWIEQIFFFIQFIIFGRIFPLNWLFFWNDEEKNMYHKQFYLEIWIDSLFFERTDY